MNMSSKKRTSKKTNSQKTKKQKRNESELLGSQSSEEEMDVDEVQIELSGFELAPEDNNGIQLLLQQLFLKNHIDLGEMTHYIIEQLDVGSVIKESEIDETPSSSGALNEDDTVFGLISVVSLTPDKDLKFIDQLRNMLLGLSKQHATEQTRNLIYSIFNNSQNTVGLILNERYINLPPSISVPSFTKLKSEIEIQSKKNPRFKFTHFVMISKLYKIPVSKKKEGSGEELNIVWCNAEEELFDKSADGRFEYAVKGDCDSGISGRWIEDDEEMLPFRRVLVFKASKLDDLVEELSSNCTE